LQVRGTAHGLSAASGKAGAVLTAFAFGSITDSIGLQGVLGLFSGIMALVAILTLLIPETKGTTLEDIENEKSFGRIVIIDEFVEDRNEAQGSGFKEGGS
jgi:PHS family inorganic phosphate transporter-like MFS transporter